LIEPGKPQQNGQHERMHRVLKAETARPPAANLTQQQRWFDRFCHEYNQLRPHEGIDLRTPACPSPKLNTFVFSTTSLVILATTIF